MVCTTVACGEKATSDVSTSDAISTAGDPPNYPLTGPKTDWNILFYNPLRTDAALGRLGWGGLGYKAFPNPPPAFMGMVSSEVSEAGEGLPNAIHIDAYGRNADVLDEIDFILGVYSPSLAKQSKAKFAQIVTDFLRDNDLSGAELVKRALANEKPDQVMVGNAILTVRLNEHGKPGSGKHDLEPIFHRPGVELQED